MAYVLDPPPLDLDKDLATQRIESYTEASRICGIFCEAYADCASYYKRGQPWYLGSKAVSSDTGSDSGAHLTACAAVDVRFMCASYHKRGGSPDIVEHWRVPKSQPRPALVTVTSRWTNHQRLGSDAEHKRGLVHLLAAVLLQHVDSLWHPL